MSLFNNVLKSVSLLLKKVTMLLTLVNKVCKIFSFLHLKYGFLMSVSECESVCFLY